LIRGSVSEEGRPIIEIQLVGPLGDLSGPATVDTGFNGWLKVTPDMVLALGLPARMPTVGQLANGQRVVFERCQVTVMWHGQPLAVRALVGDGQTLVGTRLLAGHELFVHFAPAGSVTITPA
jgi:clan AA aspartic protease